MPTAVVPPVRRGTRGVGTKAAVESGLPDRAMLGLLLPPSGSGLSENAYVTVTLAPETGFQSSHF
jgi:hypothetical protein